MAVKKTINRSGKSKDLKRHVVQEGEWKDENKHAYKAVEGEVHSDTHLEDDEGVGGEVILRHFEYVFPPNMTKKPTQEEILTDGYKKFLEAQLYMVDNLELILEPRVIIEEKGFRIFATCKPRKGHMIERRDRENVKTLMQIAHESPAGSTENRD